MPLSKAIEVAGTRCCAFNGFYIFSSTKLSETNFIRLNAPRKQL